MPKSFHIHNWKAYVGLCLAFSLVVNVLLLVSPLYMLQIYDRIMTSGSIDALIWLSVMAVGALTVYAAAEAGRRRVLSLGGEAISDDLSSLVFLRFLSDGKSQVRLGYDLSLVSRLQSTVQSGLPTAFCDLPFAPLFLILLAVLHPVLGIIGVVGMGLIVLTAIVSEIHSKRTGDLTLEEGSTARRFALGLERQRSAIAVMGLGGKAKLKWSKTNDSALNAATKTASIDGFYSGLSRTIRQILQVLALGVGAALAINQQISAGGIVAGSILMGRALSPVDHVVGGWRNLSRARAAWHELKLRVAEVEECAGPVLNLPKPQSTLEIQRLAVRIPGMETDLIRSFSHKILQGEIVAIIGGNGCGKTSLLQTLAGAWAPSDGVVRLGGRDLHDWAPENRGQYVGYMPQNIELLPISVKENVCRMNDVDDDEIFKVTRACGAHDIILRLPNGYETMIGDGGTHLSAGQTQMIGLARAMFGQPCAIFLDEPSANLDQQGVGQLIWGIKSAAQDKAVTMLSTHDPRLINIADKVLVIRDGAVMSASGSDYAKARKAQFSQQSKMNSGNV